MARIRQRANRWVVLYVADSKHRRERQDSSWVKKSDANRRLKQLEAELLESQSTVVMGKTLYRVWAERWIAVLDLAPSTMAGYRRLLTTHVLPRFGDMQLGAIRPIDVREWLRAMEKAGVGASQRRQAGMVLSGSLSEAVANDLVRSNPCHSVDWPTVAKKQVEPLTVDEVNAIASHIDHERAALVNVMAYGGLRLGEALALRRSSLTLDPLEVTVKESLSQVGLVFKTTKTGKERTVRLPESLRELFAVHLEYEVEAAPDSLLFTDSEGGPVRANNLRRREFYPAVEAAGIGRHVDIHDLRHTCASLLIRAGVGPKTVSEHLGHSSVAITFDRYGHLFSADRSQAADALDRVLTTDRAVR